MNQPPTRQTRASRLWKPVCSLISALLLFPGLSHAQISSSGGVNSLVSDGGQPLMGNDNCYDPNAGVYLTVVAWGNMFGAFTNSSGALIKSFKLGNTNRNAPFGQYPRCVYGPALNGGNGAFLVTWQQDDNKVTYVHTVVVAYPAGVISTDTKVSDGAQGGSNFTATAPPRYSSTSNRFLVVWGTLAWGIQGRFLDGTTGAPTGSILTFASGNSRDPAIAWNSATDEFGLVNAAWNDSSGFVLFRRVRASDGAVATGAPFAFSKGTFNPDVDVNPTTHHYVVGWGLGPGSGQAEIDQSGALLRSGLLSSRLGTATSFSMAYNAVSNTFLAVSENDSKEVAGMELEPSGAPRGSAPQMLTAGATTGSFVPRVTSRADIKQWLISFSRNQNALSDQVVASGSTGTVGGGGTGGGSTGGGGATPVPANFTAPTNGASVTLPVTVSWNSVSDAQAYYLTLGTTQGGRDIVDTGEISSTFLIVGRIPSNQTIYARIYTEQGGVWRSNDRTFSVGTVQAPVASFIYPTNAASNVSLSTSFQWTAPAGADKYYLYVGTTPGAKNLVDTGELTSNTYRVSNVPAGQLSYATIWTLSGGVWRGSSISFTVSAALGSTVGGSLSYPTQGAQNVNIAVPFQWSAAPGAQAYYLYVGTAPGAKDLVDTGELTTTSFRAATLPPNRTLYARLYTKVSGVWTAAKDVAFTASSAANFFNPNNGQTTPLPFFRWSGVTGAQAYYLYVGTSFRSANLINSGEIPTLYYQSSGLPTSSMLFATIWTKMNGAWTPRDLTFTIPAAALTSPSQGSNVSSSTTFMWTSVLNAQAYYLYVGTAKMTKNLVDTGEISGTSYNVSGLPTGTTLYATLWTKINGVWVANEITFTAH